MQPPASLKSLREFLAHWHFPADWFSPARFAALLALLVFASFPQVLLGLQTFVVRDFGFFAYPLAYFQKQAFWRGEIPLWNPLNDCGVPFLAQWNTMPLYPPALLYLLLPLSWSLSFFCLLHLWFAGLGAYFLARRWTGNNFAAAFAGVAFAFNGFTLNLLMWPSHIATFAWMPWVVLLVERAWHEGGRMIFLAALAGGMQMLGGGPETILFTWLLLAAMWLLELAGTPLGARERLQIARRFPFIACLVAALAAAQLLPFLDLVLHSQRDAGYADSRWALPLHGWVNFLVPLAFGRIWNMGVFFQEGQAWTSSYYSGMAATLLAVLAVWRARNRRVWLLVSGAAVAILFALGDQTWLVRGLRRTVPQLALMTYPVKFLFLVIFVLPQVAAFALASFAQKSNPKTPPRPQAKPETRSSEISVLVLGALMLSLIIALLFWIGSPAQRDHSPPGVVANGLGRVGFLVSSAGLLLAMLRGGGVFRFAPLGLLLVAWLDVLTHEPTQNPTVAPWIYQPGLARAKLEMNPPPVPGESRAMVTPHAEAQFMRITAHDPAQNLLAKRQGLFANCNLLDDMPKVNGFFSLYPREIGELMSALYGSTNVSSTGLLDFLGVVQITAPGAYFSWQARTHCLPLITTGQKPVFMDETNALRAVLHPKFNGRELVLLPPECASRVAASNYTNARIVGWRFGPEQVQCEVETDQPTLVVVAQSYYHRWRAVVDGQPAPLLRANFAFQAVPVPGGRHQVQLAYVDVPFRVGVIVSLVALGICGAGVFAARKRNA